MRWRGTAVRLACVTLLLLLALAPGLQADEIVLRSGKVHRGFARTQGAQVVLNEYGCSAPTMTLGVRRFRTIDVLETRPVPLADHVHRRLDELSLVDIPRRVDLLRLSQSGRLRAETLRVAAEILRQQPTHVEALSAIGGAEKWAALRRGNPTLDSTLALAVRRLLRLESGEDRKKAVEGLAASHGYDATAEVVERMARSLSAPRGLRVDQPLVVAPKGCKDGRYTLYVPPDYDPLVPRPLLFALHGGGIMHEKGASVRGSARDALAHFLDGAKEKGWLLCCPDAVEAPWTTTGNVAFLEAVLDEVTTLWNVDLERIHLAGQGGGGNGVWFYAMRKAQRFASVSVAAAGKPTGVSSITSKAALWLYHGETDDVVPIDPVRKTAATLLKQKAEFVYCELPKEGHGLAPAARRDLFRYIGPKRRRKARTAWPRASFQVPTGRKALEAFGDPAAAWGLGLPEDATAKELLELLSRGRTDAEPAARRLARISNDDRATVQPAVRSLVMERKTPRAGRVWAAWLCGVWRDGQAVDALGAVLRASDDGLLLRRAAEAVGRIGSVDSVQDLHWALGDVAARYRRLQGKRVAFQDFAHTCELGAAVAEAIGVVGKGDETFFAELEENLVRHVLMERRPITAVAAHGENPSEPRARLASAIAVAYRRLEAERTLFDMLRLAVRRDPLAFKAVQRALRAPPR